MENETPRLDLTVDLPEVKSRISTIQDHIRYRGGSTSAKIVVSAVTNANINGEEESINESYEMSINLGDSLVTVPAETMSSQTVTRTITNTVEVEASFISKVPPIILIIASLIVLVYMTFEKITMDESSLELLKRREKFEKFSDWISRGTLPKFESEATVNMGSLADLVDASIDMNRRVILDEEKSVYFFIHGDILYKYIEE